MRLWKSRPCERLCGRLDLRYPAPKGQEPQPGPSLSLGRADAGGGENASGAPDARGATGCARLKFARQNQETLTFITRPGGASAGSSLCLARSSWSPTPAGLRAQPTELLPRGTFQADLGRVSAPPSWCPAPSWPRSGRTASFDLRFPPSSAAGSGWAPRLPRPRLGTGQNRQLSDPKFSRDLQLPTGAPGNVQTCVGGWIRVGAQRLRVPTLGPGAGGGSREANTAAAGGAAAAASKRTPPQADVYYEN